MMGFFRVGADGGAAAHELIGDVTASGTTLPNALAQLKNAKSKLECSRANDACGHDEVVAKVLPIQSRAKLKQFDSERATSVRVRPPSTLGVIAFLAPPSLCSALRPRPFAMPS